MKAYTDINQSKKLAKFLPIESADNVIVSFGSREGTKTVVMPKETLNVIRTPFSDIRETTMCWSLAALLDVLPMIGKGEDTANPFIAKTPDGEYYIVYATLTKEVYDSSMYDNPIDACVAMIKNLHELNLL